MEKEPRFTGTTTKQRSETMRRIRGKGTSIEVALQRALWSEGIRFRKQYRIKELSRRTVDIAITKYKIAVFCDSEFFHGKDWEDLKKKLESGKNPDYWVKKIARNIERDADTDKILRSKGWAVLRFWQQDIEKDLKGCVKSIKETIFERKIEGF